LTYFKQRSKTFAFLLLFALLWAGGSNGWAQPISKEYQVKAVFLFNFARFVQWPSGALGKGKEPFRIGILGEDPFESFLDETVRGEKIDGHPLVIRRCQGLEDVNGCKILFISRSESARTQSLLANLSGRTLLTVSDMEGFTQKGGIIRFFTRENKIHFRINLEAAKRANLSISSKMLRLAEVVEAQRD